MNRLYTLLLALICLTAASCQTVPDAGTVEEPVEAPSAAVPPPPASFAPAYQVSGIQMLEGSYPDLFTGTSTAVWVDQEMTQLLRQEFAAGGAPVDPMLDMTADVVGQRLIAIECHVESMLADSSIAYDTVRFQGIECYLLTPEGLPVPPAQVIIGTPVIEEQVGTLKKFARTNILVFPRENVMLGGQAIAPDAAAVRLVLQGHGSVFAFEWPGVGQEAAAPTPYADRLGAMKEDFGEFFGKLQEVLHVFD
jgi:hypothetical protein